MGFFRVQRCTIRAAGGNIGFPCTTCGVGSRTRTRGQLASPSASAVPPAEWGAGLHPHRQRASGRSGRGERGVSHERGGRCDPVPACAICEKISEAYLLPVIRQLLDGCPFAILGFHANNGSEYINYQVAGLFEMLRVEFTTSRPPHSKDTALGESKNGGAVHKHLGSAQIPPHGAGLVNDFCANHLNPYVNFHRPCFFPETIMHAKGEGAQARSPRGNEDAL